MRGVNQITRGRTEDQTFRMKGVLMPCHVMHPSFTPGVENSSHYLSKEAAGTVKASFHVNFLRSFD